MEWNLGSKCWAMDSSWLIEEQYVRNISAWFSCHRATMRVDDSHGQSPVTEIMWQSIDYPNQLPVKYSIQDNVVHVSGSLGSEQFCFDEPVTIENFAMIHSYEDFLQKVAVPKIRHFIPGPRKYHPDFLAMPIGLELACAQLIRGEGRNK